MDANRLIALVVFLFSGYMLLDAWDKEQHPAPASAQVANTTPAAAATVPGAPAATPAAPGTSSAVPVASATGATPAAGVLTHGDRVVVTTDVYRAEFDTAGGDLRKLTLLQHLAADAKQEKLVLMQDDGVPLYVAQSGLMGTGLPNHLSTFVPSASALTLAPEQQEVALVMKAAAADGLEISKSFVFHRGSYVIDVRWQLHNTGATPVPAEAYFQFLRDGTAPPGDPRFVSSYTGPAFFTAASYFEKVAFTDIDKNKAKVPAAATDGWVAMLQHYFVAAFLPPQGVSREFFARKVSDKLYTTGVIVNLGSIAAGATRDLSVPLYAGPQEGEKLLALAPGLDKTIDFGWLAIIAVPLWHVLNFIHRWVGNWGWAIVVLTIGIKLAFFPLSAASYRSMAKMRLVAPKLQKIKEQFADDREKQNQAMMELYRNEKINPLGGCLPVFIQIPVFIALYWVLLAMVEMRHAPFMGWIHDLSAQDPLFILPVLMGISSFIQTRMQPPPPDPVQAKVMMVMPLTFSIMFFFFPAGLVLYYVVNNTLSILQQWVITRKVEQAVAAAR
ncbi:MAG: membrane protein insertase YidC [Pseudomonadota bacterium]|nr:membrane protein insertase YidC [Pseudomonadota bacterium]